MVKLAELYLMAKLISFSYSLFIFLLRLIIIPITKCYHKPLLLQKNVSALFIFGDSTFDAGNNNYINTSFQANFSPYGETYFEYPTGRFSNGRLIPDFVAVYAKLPLIPPYLGARKHEFIYGVNFASAGAGALLETRQGFVIGLKMQTSYFKNFSQLLRQKLGDEKATELLSRAVYLFSIEAIDYSFVFDTNSSALQSFSRKQFVGLVIGNITSVIKEIYEIGGRKFGFQTVRPIACVPYARIVAQLKYNESCLDQSTPFVQLHNKQLSKLLQKVRSELKGFRYSLSDYYTFLVERMNHPFKYGFKEGKVACWGSGPYRGISSCGGRRQVKKCELCKHVSEYVFFDSAHPTERVYQQFAEQAWSGKPTFQGSYNLKALFESK